MPNPGPGVIQTVNVSAEMASGPAASGGGTIVIVSQSAVPSGIANTGTVGTNGALTLGTALALTYPNIWLAFPAGALYSGSLAGSYYCQMSSATVGIVYNNLLTVGAPYIPSAPTPIVAAGPGAYTGLTTTQNLVQFVLPGNTMGPNGRLEYYVTESHNNSAGNKTLSLPWGAGNIYTAAATTTATLIVARSINNRGTQLAQGTEAVGNTGNFTTTAGIYQSLSLDTSTAQTLSITGLLGTATDVQVVESYRVLAYYGA